MSDDKKNTVEEKKPRLSLRDTDASEINEKDNAVATDVESAKQDEPEPGKMKLKLGKPSTAKEDGAGGDKLEDNLPEPPPEALDPASAIKEDKPEIKAGSSLIKGTKSDKGAGEPNKEAQIKGTKPKLSPKPKLNEDQDVITSSGKAEEKSGLVVAATSKKRPASDKAAGPAKSRILTTTKKNLPPTKVAIPPTRMMKSKGNTEKHNILGQKEAPPPKSKSYLVLIVLGALIAGGVYLVKTGQVEGLMADIKGLNTVGINTKNGSDRGTDKPVDPTQENVENFIKQMSISGAVIGDEGTKLMVGTHVYVEGDYVDEALGIQFVGADTKERLARFRDENGQLYGRKY